MKLNIQVCLSSKLRMYLSMLLLPSLALLIGEQQSWLVNESRSAKAQAGPTITVTMSVVTPQPVLSGNAILWEIGWQCSSVDNTPCTGARIDVTKPTRTTNVASAVGAPGFTTSAFIDGTGAHFIFIDPLPAGSSGTVQVQYTSRNLHTPDGTILEPMAIFSVTNPGVDSMQASAGASIKSTLNLGITKRRFASEEPPPDVNVTYEIRVFDSSWPNYNNPLPGTWIVENAVVTDPLPAGAVFVSATSGGTYDMGTHSVTWPAIPEVNTYEARGDVVNCRYCFYVTVKYPSSIFTPDNEPTDPSDNVTNMASVAGKPSGLPADPDVTAQDSDTHGFILQPQPLNSIFTKSAFSTGVREGKEIAAFHLSWQNRSSVPALLTALERLPCQTDSPTGALTICANPGLHLTRLRVPQPITSGPITVNYTTNLGNTGTVELTERLVLKSPGVDDVVPRIFDPGEYVSHFTVVGTIAGGYSLNLDIYGTIAPDFPDDPATESETMRNCAQGSLDFGTFGGVLGPFEPCATLNVVPAKPSILHFKGGTGLGAIAPTEARTFDLRSSNQGDAPWRPVVTELLPLSLRYVLGSQTSNYAFFPELGGVPPTFELVDDFNGSGRQLLRWSWPGGEGTNPPSNYLTFFFDARVEPGTPAGTYTNEGQFFDAVSTNNNTPLTNICVYSREPDVGDYDGDGDSDEYRCIATFDYTVVETASMTVRKEVRGSLDSDFQASPAVGLVNPSSPADYRITLQNTGNVNLTHLVAYDILPFVGDKGVSGTQLNVPRGSQWQPLLAGAVTAPAGVTVEYSLSENPCRGEVIAQGGAMDSGPAGCTNDWTPSPTDFSLVRALRLSLSATPLAGGEERSMIVPMSAPAGVDGIAWNTVALAGQRADSGAWLLPTEPPKVGLAVPIDLELNKTVMPATSVSPGTELTYVLELTNRGPGSASGIEVVDLLPAEVTFVSTDPAAAYDSMGGLWMVGDLGPDATATLTLVATVNAGTEGSTFTNYAQVSAANQQDFDSTPGNNTGPDPAEDDEAAVGTSVVVLQMSVETSDVSCRGAQNGAIVVTASGGTPPHRYSNDGGTTFQDMNTFGNLAAGVYHVVVMDADGHTVESAVEVSELGNVVCTGRMTGGGKVSAADGNQVSHGFELHCDLSLPNNLQLNWSGRKFHLTQLDAATCSDEPDINEGQPVAGFDTFVGRGVGRLDGLDGATVAFTLTDAGEPGKDADFATFFINGGADLDVSGTLRSGNHQAHAAPPQNQAAGFATRRNSPSLENGESEIFLPHFVR